MISGMILIFGAGNNMAIDNEYKQVVAAIMKSLNAKMHRIGGTIDADTRRMIIQEKIYDRGDFLHATGYEVVSAGNHITLKFGSNVSHAPFVLGGKVPSWTPVAPIKAWVERKNLSWVDKKTGNPLTVDAMAWMIVTKIRREGIKARNVFEEVFRKREAWIYQTLESLEG